MIRTPLAFVVAFVTMTAAFAAPVAAETIVHDWGARDMALIFSELQIDRVTQATRKDGAPVVSGKTAGVLIGAVGDSCKEGANTRCGSVDFVCDLSLADADKADKAMALLVYPQAGVLRAGPTAVRLHRHVLLEGGVTEDNLRANVMLFVQTVFDAQNRLQEAKLD